MVRNVDGAEDAGADVRFALAYERLSAEDAERSAWLESRCRVPDHMEEFVTIFPGESEHKTSAKCAAVGCNRKPRAKGFCDMHYRQWRRDGLTQREYRKRVRENGEAA